MRLRFNLTLTVCLMMGLGSAPLAAVDTPPVAPPIPLAIPQTVIDPAQFGFSTEASGLVNAKALQQAFDQRGQIAVTRPGVYRIANTVYIGSDTAVRFAPGVILRKEAEAGPFSHVILNKGAVTRTYDRNIAIEGLHIVVNEVDRRTFKEAYGLHGQLAFFYVQDLRISGFRCFDLGPAQYGIQVCTFEDVQIRDVIIKGRKDGVHLGRGNRFSIRDGIFETYDDAIALNAHDYASGNPELGWIENGVIENCHDLPADKAVGFFCRILGGGWIDWKPGMEVQNSDTVVANGRLYRVKAKADGTVYTSSTQPSHETGAAELDGITWVMIQKDVTYTAGVRNVMFRDIFLEKRRTGFSVHFDNDKYSRSYYPGAQVPQQQNLVFDNIQCLQDPNQPAVPLFNIVTPVDTITLTNSRIANNLIRFSNNNKTITDFGRTQITLLGCTFTKAGPLEFLNNSVVGKELVLKTTGSLELSPAFSAQVKAGGGTVTVQSDLTGLRNP